MDKPTLHQGFRNWRQVQPHPSKAEVEGDRAFIGKIVGDDGGRPFDHIAGSGPYRTAVGFAYSIEFERPIAKCCVENEMPDSNSCRLRVGLHLWRY